ncbi:PTS sugar transporter subunit IIB [Neobacillus muris]|uniref:PTS sugar transporter subunit IIB n=1 Tax=Neobacillus muris TaxID=2941334 RepID=UPI00203F9159|nr:PTS sugar transporter subunit IIB [Neobacillus muris]
MKTIIIACGAGVATSTIIVDRVNTLLRENNIQAKIIQCMIGDIDGHADSADVIVTSMKLDKKYNAPVIMGLSFITGIGKEETEKELLDYLG